MIDFILAFYIGAGFGAALTASVRLKDGRTPRERIAPGWLRQSWLVITVAGILWPLWTIYITRARLQRERYRQKFR